MCHFTAWTNVLCKSLACMLLALSAIAADGMPKTAKTYSPPVAADYPQRVFWGDLHLHTRHSADAYGFGTQAISMADAYRFARGQELTTSTGQRARLRRPLDFLAITDHAEYLGAYYHTDAGHTESGAGDLAVTPLAKRWAEFLKSGEDIKLLREFVTALTQQSPDLTLPESYYRYVWSEVTQVADEYNDPGNFTALIGYEWSSQPGGNNLHRVVIYRDDAATVSQLTPFSAQDSKDPEDLWAALQRYETSTGGRAMAIPHNGNLSNGLMFAEKTLKGEPLIASYAKRRARWGPVVEVTQVKCDGEAHPTLSPTDEFANYENWDQFNIMMIEPKQPWMLRTEYARSALGVGLQQQRKTGANPFQFGMVGATDSHTGMSTTNEDNFFGKFPSSEPSAERMFASMAPTVDIPARNWSLAASGLTGVWARENTRESLFDALARREVYATTGTRISVRLFGGWDYQARDVLRADYVRIGYSRGVPMGGELSAAPSGRSPGFMVAAAKDPDGANLDRIQIIKGWIDAENKVHEKIYDIALADGRQVNLETGKAPPVGNTVDIAEPSYTNAIGDPGLATVWVDPDFDPQNPAFYYARVIEIPTPRWTAYDAGFFKRAPPEGVPMTTTKRAYTSPIWYQPD
jgi:hypothetical protein